MKQRDKQILDDLIQFRCMSRDDIVDLHFKGLKNPVNSCNSVLKRMHRDNLIERSTHFYPYVYFPAGKTIKKDSAKVPHFLEIVKVYRDMCQYKKPTVFTVEPKYGKGNVEPDIFAIWKGTPFFIEVQRSVYTDQVMSEKMERYEALKLSGSIKEEPWQPEGKEIFPTILLLTNNRYNLQPDMKVIQLKDIHEFIKMVEQKTVKPSSPPGIKVRIG